MALVGAKLPDNRAIANTVTTGDYRLPNGNYERGTIASVFLYNVPEAIMPCILVELKDGLQRARPALVSNFELMYVVVKGSTTTPILELQVFSQDRSGATEVQTKIGAYFANEDKRISPLVAGVLWKYVMQTHPTNSSLAPAFMPREETRVGHPLILVFSQECNAERSIKAPSLEWFKGFANSPRLRGASLEWRQRQEVRPDGRGGGVQYDYRVCILYSGWYTGDVMAFVLGQLRRWQSEGSPPYRLSRPERLPISENLNRDPIAVTYTYHYSHPPGTVIPQKRKF